MDSADIANDNIDILTAARINSIRQRQQSTGDTSTGVRYCSDCGEEIPQARLRAVPGATRCRDCQDRYERTHR